MSFFGRVGAGGSRLTLAGSGKAARIICSQRFGIGYTKVMSCRYTVLFEREADGGYHAFCPALPGCHSQGDTLDEAVANVREAIGLYIESLIAHNEPLPVEDLLIKPIEVALPV